LIKRGDIVTKSSRTHRYIVRTAHRDGTLTIEAMFALWPDGTDVPGWIGGTHRAPAADFDKWYRNEKEARERTA
jgi:hypothetical protein